ncbi:MAG: SDR family oxidoreductase [Chloroflexi bacterium]|nr:SDR family oxidoreductase [Chloroflexota bacterium]
MDLTEVTKLYDLSGKTVVITGGAGVLGGEMACALVGCNANVVILDRDTRLAEQVVHRIKGMEGVKGEAIIVYGDVLKRDSLIQADEEIQRELGGIYAVINGAGGNRAEATTGADLSFFDLPDEALRFVFDLNILGTIMPSQIFGKRMAQQNEGIILNVSSMSAFAPLTRIPAYSAAKAGVSNFTQWLAVHMAQEYSPNIRVNAIAPGFFLTQQNRFLLTDQESGELTDRGRTIIDHTPMDRFGNPEDLLGAVFWLLSPLSSFVTGVVLPIDGGFNAFSGV